jgi:MFS family permease
MNTDEEKSSNGREEAEVPDLHPNQSSTDSPVRQDAPLSRTKSATSAALARVTSRFTTRSITDPGPPPDGGLRAWIQVACAWVAITTSWGFVNSFGAFQTYYEEILPQSNSTISWIGSTQACLMFVIGTFSGRAFDAGWFLPTVIFGMLVQFIGIFTMSLATNYWQLLLSHGVCTGLGGGIFFIPIMSLVSTYFAKRRGLALGIVTTGNSIGGIVYPTIVRQLLGRVGFGWTVRVLGLINVITLCTILVFMKPRLPPRKSGPLFDPDTFRDVPYLLYVLGTCFLMPPVYFVYYYVCFHTTRANPVPLLHLPLWR